MRRILRKYSFPGLKRWFTFLFLALFAIVFGLALILKAHPITRIAQFTWNMLSFVADKVPPTVSGIVVMVFGVVLLFYSFFRANKQVLSVVAPDQSSLLDMLDRAHMSNKGPKILAIGGGTGLANMLKGLKLYTGNITAVVTVADDGGSSGRLRESMNIVPPGDIRNCIAALSHDDEVITQLFQYRFDNDAPKDLQNHSFGNLFLTALVELGDSKTMSEAVKHACRILKARGKVLPVSNDPMQLVAEFEDGTIVEGESKIPIANGKIKKLYAKGKPPVVLPEVIDAIKEAEVIVLGPGSLYTSIIPNLIVPELVDAITRSNAVKIYVCNVMTQPGETSDYSASAHLQAIKEHTKEFAVDFTKIVNFILVNNVMPHKHQLQKYKADGQFPVEIDYAELRELGVSVYPSNLLQRGNLVRHNPYKLAKSVMQIYERQLRSKDRALRKLIKMRY